MFCILICFLAYLSYFKVSRAQSAYTAQGLTSVCCQLFAWLYFKATPLETQSQYSWTI